MIADLFSCFFRRRESIMPRALASTVRRAIWNRLLAGTPLGEVAVYFGVSERTVRRLVVDVESRGEKAFANLYEACGARQSNENRKLRRRIVKLRAKHARWGAGRLLLEFQNKTPGQHLPCKRSVERWLAKAKCPLAPAGRPLRRRREDRADRPHQVWQIDAAEQKRLATGRMISWLRIADECSGAVLKTIVFSRGPFHAGPTPAGTTPFEAGFLGVGLAGGMAN
jgi:hypothetical protein